MEQFYHIVAAVKVNVQQFDFWWQLLALATALLLASLTNQRLQRLIAAQSISDSGLRHLAVRSIQRLLWPLTSLAILLPVKIIFEMNALPIQILAVAVPVLVALAVIRLVVYILRKAFGVSPLLKSSENLLAGIIWFGVLLHLAGWLPGVLAVLEGLAMTIGETRISLLAIIKLILMIALAFTLAIWLAEFISQRVQRSAHISPSMQVGFAKFWWL
jgi:hypothetical protein